MSFYVNHVGELEYLRAETLDGVRHGFSTRFGGVSEGHLKSLNLGTHRGDDPDRVAENYRRFCAALEIPVTDLVFAKQIHSDIVAHVGAGNRGEGLEREVPAPRDALITDTPGAALVVFTADCAPVLFHDPVRCAVGAAHSGWRGTAQDIAGKTVAAMTAAFGTRAEDLRAAVGPCIGPCCFETDSDVPEAMRAQLGEAAEEAIEPRGNKFYVNNPRLIFLELLRAGLRPEHIDVSGECTACQTDRFWSHRKVGDRRGSMANIIAL